MDLVHCGQKMKGWSLKNMTLVKSFVSASVSFCYRYSFHRRKGKLGVRGAGVKRLVHGAEKNSFHLSHF